MKKTMCFIALGACMIFPKAGKAQEEATIPPTAWRQLLHLWEPGEPGCMERVSIYYQDNSIYTSQSEVGQIVLIKYEEGPNKKVCSKESYQRLVVRSHIECSTHTIQDIGRHSVDWVGQTSARDLVSEPANTYPETVGDYLYRYVCSDEPGQPDWSLPRHSCPATGTTVDDVEVTQWAHDECMGLHWQQ